jgi:hypothetical protein
MSSESDLTKFRYVSIADLPKQLPNISNQPFDLTSPKPNPTNERGDWAM